MKVQIETSQWRLRIDEDELRELLSGETISMESHVAGRFILQLSITLVDTASAQLQGDPTRWAFLLPAAAVGELAKRLPTRDGLRFAIAAGAGGAPDMDVLFDVDVRDSARRLKASRQGKG